MQELDSRPTILVVDDPSANPELLAEILGAYGYRVAHCKNEAEARAAVERNPPDFIVLSPEQVRGMLQDWRQRLAQEVEERTRQLLEAQKIAGLGAWQIDIERDLIEWIGETYRMFGFGSGEPLSFRESLSHLRPEDRERALAAWEAALAVPAARYDVSYRVYADGRERWLRELAQIERAPDGRAVRALGAVQDITASKSYEAALQDQQQRLETALEAANAGAWEWNIRDGTVRVSEWWARMLGYDPSEVACLSLAERQALAHADEREHVRTILEDCLAGRLPAFEAEYRIRHQDGRWIWVRSLGRIIRRDGAGKPLAIAGIDVDITQQKTQQAQLAYIDSHDVLTGLPNRKAFARQLAERMESCLQRGERLAVAYVDVDGLARINEKRGREFGDRLILEITERLARTCGRDDVARTGGDEFACVFHGDADDDDFKAALERLMAQVSAPASADGFVATASIGVATYPQHAAIDAEQLLRQADQAMYQSKLSGKNCYTFFDAELDESTREHRAQLEEIRRGIADDQFLLHYQPKVNMRTGQVHGFEALVRWQRPGSGLLPPDQFVPLLEGHPLAIELGDRVISMALAQLHAWKAEGFETTISVNVTSDQLHDAEFIPRLEREFRSHRGLRREQLRIEVVETGAMRDMPRVAAMVARLDEMGIKVALDDFGTGFSSLTFLKQLAARIIKIDQSFVRDLLDDQEHAVIVDSICRLAESFSRRVIAEGVETEVHGRLLLELGCEFGQGYAVARPMPAGAVRQWAETWQPPESWGDSAVLARERVPELLAELGHRAWRNALRKFLVGDRKSPPELDYCRCRLGLWLEDAATAVALGGHPDFMPALELHRASHAAAREAIAELAADPGRDVEEGLAAFFEISNQLLDRLKSLRKRP